MPGGGEFDSGCHENVKFAWVCPPPPTLGLNIDRCINTECISGFSFTQSEKLINVLNSKGIGNVKIVLSESKVQQSGAKGKESSKVIAGNKGANVRDSPLEAQVQTRRFRPVLSFGQEGKYVGMLDAPWGVAVNDHDEIAVTEFCNNRVSVFSSDGTHLRSFGREG